MGASMVKQCFVAEPHHASAFDSRSSSLASVRSSKSSFSAHAKRTPSRPPPQHPRLLPPQPGAQPYALQRDLGREKSLHQHSYRELQPRDSYASPGPLPRPSSMKMGPRDRWDSRESTCSSSMSMEEELVATGTSDDQERHRRRPYQGSTGTPRVHDGSLSARTPSSRHGSSVSGCSSTATSTASRRSQLSSPSRSHQDLLPPIYVLEDLLGSGSTSKCYRCRRTTDNRVLACKIINKRRLAFDPYQREDLAVQLRREVKILRSLDHPHIAKLEDAFENDSYIILMMELLDGGELFETIVDRGRLSETDAKQVAARLLSAISYMHARGIVHRDLKPENLLLATKTARGSPLQVKIIDFGFASSHATMTSILGTGGYLAPEILMQRPYTAAVDTWSFGVLLYLMLCGRLPFTTATQLQPGQRLSKLYKVSFPDKYWAGVSQSARDLVSNLLVLNPSFRLAPADALTHAWFYPEAVSSSSQ